MGLFDSPEQKAEAQMNVGRAQIRLANEGRASALPTDLSNEVILKLSKAGTKKLLEGTMKLNRLKANQSTDESQ